jgi:hypothetical protein
MRNLESEIHGKRAQVEERRKQAGDLEQNFYQEKLTQKNIELKDALLHHYLECVNILGMHQQNSETLY